jgi:hypothetical protein
MSLCYDFSKWTMISLASIAISLTIGLISLAYGLENGQPESFLRMPIYQDKITDIEYKH